MDNTCRDNKNKYVLTFAAILVEFGIFRKVSIDEPACPKKHSIFNVGKNGVLTCGSYP